MQTQTETSEALSASPAPAKPRLPRRWLLAGGLLILLLIGAAWWFTRPRGPEFSTLTLAPVTLTETIDVSGVVESERSVSLKASVSGRVLERRVAENQRVPAGVPILSLDTAQLRLQLQQARTQSLTSQQQAQAEIDSAAAAIAELERRRGQNLIGLRNQIQKAEEGLFFLERELLRLQRLLAEDAVTAQSVDQQRQQVDIARIDLRTAQQNLNAAERTDPELVNARSRLQQARTSLDNARRSSQASIDLAAESLRQAALLAPFAGSVTSWNVQRGDFLSPGSLVARYQDLSDLRLILAVNELDFPKIRLQAPVEITFDAYPDQIFRGSVVWRSLATVAGAGGDAIAGGATSASAIQVFPIKVWFDNPAALIKPGMSGDARITVAQRERILAVPIGAISKGGGQYRVKVLREGKPVEVDVTVGMSTLDQVEIRSGLKAGDQIVLDQPLPSPSPS
ncbi:MAG: hypothetical protein CVV27_04195 [Candidatus Melainabacteria bacterium HGW-Melainabacteria-1]|nr:MAG: hypothetical protein CVV27_04195 [Candidatus Melainabacteria bacterium HGW-Melainabacteria-1]